MADGICPRRIIAALANYGVFYLTMSRQQPIASYARERERRREKVFSWFFASGPECGRSDLVAAQSQPAPLGDIVFDMKYRDVGAPQEENGRQEAFPLDMGLRH
ncbi:MAG TPA: hypothetical protein VMW16_08450 [Sedimentisphaerales bacterium]|nr:hypothetical protein [Sedimentisphaerales bacterium]